MNASYVSAFSRLLSLLPSGGLGLVAPPPNFAVNIGLRLRRATFDRGLEAELFGPTLQVATFQRPICQAHFLQCQKRARA